MYSFHEIRAGTLATLHEGVDCLVGDIDDLADEELCQPDVGA
jgi:hypothetical protein